MLLLSAPGARYYSAMTVMRRIFLPILIAMMATFAVHGPALAAGDDPPFWVTVRFDEVRMRVGPSREYPIEWVYRRKGLPMQVLRAREGWLLVRDPDGAQGWIAESQLIRTRGVLIVGEGLATLRETPDAGGGVRWRAQPGVVGELGECTDGWCEINITGRKGWIEASRLWGDEELAADE